MFNKGKDEGKPSYCEYKNRSREEKREEKNRKREEKERYREEKREEKRRHRQEKREEKLRHQEAKRRLREGHIPTSESSTPNIIINHTNVRVEHDVATIRTIFPDCDPEFIRNCLANEPDDDRVRKVTEKLLTTNYPKVEQVSHLAPPTAPPLPTRSSFEIPFDEAPPSYEESLGNQSLQAPPLPNRHRRASSWNGTAIISEQPGKSVQSTRSIQSKITNCNAQASQASAMLNEAIDSTVKSFMSSVKPSTVEQACHKYSYIWSRPVPSNFTPKPLSQLFKILPKDKYSIQKGFSQSGYPSGELRSHDISEEDWYLFMSGLNSIIGVNSVKKGRSSKSDSFDVGFPVGLKWVSWMNVTMDDKLMESNITAINEYLSNWNNTFFNPRHIKVQFIDDKSPTNPTNNPFRQQHPFSQYLLVNAI